eukprot:s916_g6.t1
MDLADEVTPQQIMDRLDPSKTMDVRSRLLRQSLIPVGGPMKLNPKGQLETLLSRLVSTKGEDILLNSSTDQLHSFQRLRQTVPARLWRWKIISGWRWAHGREHINALELRALEATIRWRVERRGDFQCRFVHLTDSLVSLHTVSRGRSSSRKLRRSVCRLNAVLLASGVAPVWGYVHTDSNPADKPYDKALNQFLQFLKHNQLSLPFQRDRIDPLAAEYLEHLWSSGSGRGLASDTLAALQDPNPRLRGLLPISWRLLKTWHTHEIPSRAPPFPEYVLHCLTGWALMREKFNFAVSLLVGFYAMLRTGELLALEKRHFSFSVHSVVAVITLGFTKGGKRLGVSESVTLTHELALKFLRHWLALAAEHQKFCTSPASWRATFSEGLKELGLSEFEFRPYSLRRGATWYFSKFNSLDKVMVMGRWQAARTARLHLNEGLATLAEMRLQPHNSHLSF